MIKRFFENKSFITLLIISFMILIIIGTFFVFNGYVPKTNTECYWTTKGIICNWGKVGE